jgi:predicted amidohydrolase
MKVAAYQAPLLTSGSMDALPMIRRRVEQCEAEGITVLCCPEAILGGLADYSPGPKQFAVLTSRLAVMLAPLASDRVTTIVGFTELAADETLYNSAAVLCRGTIAGVYRKQRPAIRRSVYAAGTETPVFRVDGLAFGIAICNDSNFPELVAGVARRGATALFVPSNNGLLHARASGDIVDESRRCDAARAIENGMWIIRADVAGRSGDLASAGCSGIVRPDGSLARAARPFEEDFLVADVGTTESG